MQDGDACRILRAYGIELDVYVSEADGALAIHIEADEERLPCNALGPAPLRVYINDGAPVYANPEYPSDWVARREELCMRMGMPS